MAWILLAFAIVFEIAGTTCMKLSDGFQAPLPSVLVFVFYAISFALMIFALKGVDLGVAYAVWSGLGTAAIAVIGILVFGETATAIKAASILLIIAGVVGLKLSG